MLIQTRKLCKRKRISLVESSPLYLWGCHHTLTRGSRPGGGGRVMCGQCRRWEGCGLMVARPAPMCFVRCVNWTEIACISRRPCSNAALFVVQRYYFVFCTRK
ncbi:unnamed protein product [Chrysodeixis includens]|uniref:Uncharacterized protein n=1 Tax=Chrysodeixis includens TaxID=689277 RepID=A0A9N8L4D7_CHRIL|nr:unnamed protein product [Chrysodeixis includens]